MITVAENSWIDLFWGRDESIGELFRIQAEDHGPCYARRIAAHHALYYGLSHLVEPPRVVFLEWKARPQFEGGTWQIVPDRHRLVELFNGEMEELLMELLL